jgi:hypothetical protein
MFVINVAHRFPLRLDTANIPLTLCTNDVDRMNTVLLAFINESPARHKTASL